MATTQVIVPGRTTLTRNNVHVFAPGFEDFNAIRNQHLLVTELTESELHLKVLSQNNSDLVGREFIFPASWLDGGYCTVDSYVLIAAKADKLRRQQETPGWFWLMCDLTLLLALSYGSESVDVKVEEVEIRQDKTDPTDMALSRTGSEKVRSFLNEHYPDVSLRGIGCEIIYRAVVAASQESK